MDAPTGQPQTFAAHCRRNLDLVEDRRPAVNTTGTSKASKVSRAAIANGGQLVVSTGMRRACERSRQQTQPQLGCFPARPVVGASAHSKGERASDCKRKISNERLAEERGHSPTLRSALQIFRQR